MKARTILMMVAVSLMAASATANLVVDGSFTALDASAGGYAYSDGSVSPWISFNYSAIMNGPAIRAAWSNTAYPLAGADGDDQYLASLSSYMLQDLTASIVPGQEYVLSMSIAALSDGQWILPHITGAINPATGLPWESSWGSPYVNGWFEQAVVTTVVDGDGDGADDWEQVTWNFIAADVPNTSFYLYGPNIFVDDVSIAAVPEPATMLILGLGGLFLRRRRA